MIIIGISFSHNGSICLLKEGKVIVAIQAERLTRLKRQSLDLDKNKAAVNLCLNYCLTYSNIKIEDIDYIAFSTPWGFKNLKQKCMEWAKEISPNKKIVVKNVSHHLAHAEYIIHYGNNEDGIVCVIDGSGSHGNEILENDYNDLTIIDENINTSNLNHTQETVSLYQYKQNKLLTKFKVLSSNTKVVNFLDKFQSYIHSIGHLWEIVSDLIFEEKNQAGKVMGLIGFSKEKKCVKFLKIGKDFKPIIDVDLINEEIKKIKIKKNKPTDISYIADIIQENTNDYVITLLNKFISEQDTAIYLSGGVMLNIKLNTEIAKNFPNKKIIVNGSTEDNGTAIGAAAAIYRRLLKTNITENPSDYYGKEYLSEEVERSLIEKKLNFKTLNKKDLSRFIAKEIIDSKVIMLSYGRSEFGPRALGHRSILANAFDPLTKYRLDTEIKLREPYRPYAPIVLEDDYKKYFDLKSTSPFMLFDSKVLSKDLPAITHVDGTSRPQTVNKNNGIIYDILINIKEIKGIPVCLNTSLNRPGEPICETPEDAINYALNSKADYLVIENFLISLSK
mgnify:CR=1 FL=1